MDFTLQVIDHLSSHLFRIRLHPVLALGQLHGAGQECLGQGLGRSWQPLCGAQQPVQAPQHHSEGDFLGGGSLEEEGARQLRE